MTDVCEECKVSDSDGWADTKKRFYCKACWKQHEVSSFPEEVAVPKTFISRNGSKRHKSGWGFMKYGSCGCCSTDWWSELVRGHDPLVLDVQSTACWPALRGVPFGDCHIHLDGLIQNRRNNGYPGWDNKARLCKYFDSKDDSKNTCPMKDKCMFAHGEADRTPRRPLEPDDVTPFLRVFGSLTNQQKSESPLEGPTLEFLIQNCCELDAIEDTRILAKVFEEKLPGVLYLTFGCHPHTYRDYNDEYEEKMLVEFKSYGNRAVAWGECGLDYYKNEAESKDPLERQRMIDLFSRQARMSVKLDVPLVVHSRDADGDTLAVFREFLPRGHRIHWHSFVGKKETVRRVLDEFPNCVFGVSGAIAMVVPNDDAVEIAKLLPLDRLVLETDAPYLSRGPIDVPRIATVLAKLQGVDPVDILTATTENIRRTYGVPHARPPAAACLSPEATPPPPTLARETPPE